MKFVAIGIVIVLGLLLVAYSTFFYHLGISSNPRDWESTAILILGILAAATGIFTLIESRKKNQVDLIKHDLQEIEKTKESIPDMETPVKGKKLNDFITPFEQAHSDIKDIIRIFGEKYNLKSKLNCSEFEASLEAIKKNWSIYKEKYHIFGSDAFCKVCKCRILQYLSHTLSCKWLVGQ